MCTFTYLDEIPCEIHNIFQERGNLWINCCRLFIHHLACLLRDHLASAGLWASFWVYSNEASKNKYLTNYHSMQESCVKILMKMILSVIPLKKPLCFRSIPFPALLPFGRSCYCSALCSLFLFFSKIFTSADQHSAQTTHFLEKEDFLTPTASSLHSGDR